MSNTSRPEDMSCLFDASKPGRPKWSITPQSVIGNQKPSCQPQAPFGHYLEPGKHTKSEHSTKVIPSSRPYERQSACQNTVPSVGCRQLACCIYGAKSSSVGRDSPTCLVSRGQVTKDPLAPIYQGKPNKQHGYIPDLITIRPVSGALY